MNGLFLKEILWQVNVAGIDAETEAATGSVAAAFLHRHYSQFLDAPQISGRDGGL